MKNLTIFFLSFIAIFFSSIAIWFQCEIPLMAVIFMCSLIFFIIFLIFRVNTVTTKNYVSLLKNQQNQIDVLQEQTSKLVEILKEIESNKKEKFELHEGMIKNLQERADNIQKQINIISFFLD